MTFSCTPDNPSGLFPWNPMPPPRPPSYEDYISEEGYREIQGLLRRTDILTNGKLDKIPPILPNNFVLAPFYQALGPKTDEGLIDWYVENFLPKAEGSHQYLYVDSVMKLTVGMGTNLADERLTVYESVDKKTGKTHYSSTPFPNIKKKKVSKFDPELFLQDDEYKNAILDKLLTVIKTFYIGDPVDIRKDRYTSQTKASRQQLLEALTDIAQRIHDEKEKKKTAKKYHIPGAKSYVSEKNAVYADKEDTDTLEREFLEKMMPGLHQQVPRFSQFPAGAQLAILDMAYNTNFYRWKKTKSPVELHPFYQEISQQTVDWDLVATDAKDPKGCLVDDVTQNFTKKTAKCTNFYFWRKKIGLTRNVATQILLILADEWDSR